MTPRILSILFLTAPLALASCSTEGANASTEPAAAAPSAEAPTTSTAAPAVDERAAAEHSLAGAGGDYELDPSHTQVVFRVDHLGISHQLGRFNKVTGALSIDESNPANSSVSIEVDAASVFTADKKRDKHLRSPDFFDAKQFPVITFESATVAPKGGNAYDVTGTLSLHGVSKTVTIPIEHVGATEDPWGSFRAGFYGELTINRSDYGISTMEGVVGEQVTLMLSVEAIRK